MVAYNSLIRSHLGSEVIRVVSLRGSEVGAEHGFRHANSDLQFLHSLPHGLLWSDCNVQSTTRSRLKEIDVLLHVHRNGHETEKGSKQSWPVTNCQQADNKANKVNEVTKENWDWSWSASRIHCSSQKTKKSTGKYIITSQQLKTKLWFPNSC